MSRVVFMCGPSGAGKTTYARRLEESGWVRLSFDVELWRRGVTEVPPPADVRADVERVLRERLLELVAADADVVLDFSFWSRRMREEWRAVLAPTGVVPEVHHLDTDRATVLARLAHRRGAHSDDFEIPPDLAARYVDHFEAPTADEGPLVVLRSYPETVLAGPDLRLRLATDADAETLSAWTAAPEVHRSWGPGRRLSVEEVRAKYTGHRAPVVVSYVACRDEEPVGYLQAWQRDGRRGLDMFLAAHAQGRGTGPRAARALAVELDVRGWRPLTVDPAADDDRAVAAWRAAGFEPTGELGSDEGRVTRLMVFAGAAG